MDAFGPLPERQDMIASRRAQSPAQGADRTSVPTQDTLPQLAPHHRSHASRCTRYVGVLRTARHSGRTRSPTVHAHICTHYPPSPIIPPTYPPTPTGAATLDRKVLATPEKRRTDARTGAPVRGSGA